MTYGAPVTGAPRAGRHAWALDERESQPFLRQALDLGINFFDTANIYSSGASEVVLGRFLEANVRRESVVVATKVHGVMRDEPNGQGLSRKAIFFEVEESLRRLGTDYIDLYQIHRWDPETPIEETLEALHDLVRSGKVRYLGASSMHAWQFTKALYLADLHGWTRFVSMQNHYNLLYREEEREMNPLCLDQGVGLLPWSPLARGFLAGNRGREDKTAGATSRAQTDEIAQRFYYQDSDFAVVDALKKVAEARGEPMARVAYAWLLGRPGVTAPIIGASKVWQLEEAVGATELALSAADVEALDLASRDLRVIQARFLLVHGIDDEIIPYGESIGLARAIGPGRARLVLLQGFRHVDIAPRFADGWRLWRALSALLRERCRESPSWLLTYWNPIRATAPRYW